MISVHLGSAVLCVAVEREYQPNMTTTFATFFEVVLERVGTFQQ